MIGLSFAAPLALLGLLALPAIYFLLRVTPPRPREYVFPAIELLRGIDKREETPAKTPWPLLLLRLCVAAAIAFAFAGPLWRFGAAASAGAGPLLLLVDDGWAAAPTFEKRRAAAESALDEAARVGAPVALWPLSEAAAPPQLASAPAAAEKLRALRPKPFLPPRPPAAARLTPFFESHAGARLLWIADGLTQAGDEAFFNALRDLAGRGVSVSVARDAAPPLALTEAENAAAALSVAAQKLGAGGAETALVEAYDSAGRVVAGATLGFGADGKATARFDLPPELRNEVSLLRIASEASAGAVALLDSRAKALRVAIIGGSSYDAAQPLLSGAYYLQRALSPFAQALIEKPGDVDPIATALAAKPQALLLADVGLTPEAEAALLHYLEEGGVVIRFAGPRLANASDDLSPVRLRRNGRVLGGAMSWETPKKLAAFEPGGPFAGLAPNDDVSVTRQVLAEPDPDLSKKTFARLADGTPLVTGEARGKGVLALFHVGADASWSNLPISGLFVDMLRRLCGLTGAGLAPLAAGAADMSAGALAPLRSLDGYGVLGTPPPTARALPSDFAGVVDADHPPGFYGSGAQALALQTIAPGAPPRVLDFDALGLPVGFLPAVSGMIDFRPPLLVFVFLGLLIDWLATLALGGRLRRAVLAAGLAALFFSPAAPQPPAAAETPGRSASAPRDRDAALNSRLAYVLSGDPQIDETSRLGLEALSRALAGRTSYSPGPPAGVDPAKDELAFYPLLYWPISAAAPQPAARAVARVAAFLKQGGTIIFDTRDAPYARKGAAPTPEALWLRELSKGLDIPELEPVPRDHVITKTFYLLDNFVGRYEGGETWVEALPAEPTDGAARPVRPTDSVSPVVIVANDLAGAWAQDKSGRALFPLVPGGARQRELALRGGVNLVMYTLTGNYKSDQVHVRDLLQRLGQ
jgi:hypothetical protein